MSCGSCSTGGGCAPAGCKSNGACLTNGCSKLDVYDWLSHMDMPANYKPFQIIEIKFKGSRKDFFVNQDNIYLEAGELVAVETTTGGYDIGHVSLTGELVRMQMTKRHVKEADVAKKIYRKATEADVNKWKLAKELEWETMHKARTLALELNLSMKLSDVDYQGDKTKAVFYYTAEGRVDFRELIKKMAEAFRIRIEMRQIGMRQEASRLGGIGSCGRELCCSTWLTDFKTVSTSAARYQNLSLNTLKLAGQCGKLKCCLNYELDTYMDALKHIPDNVSMLKTEKGEARLQKTDIFKKLMWFSYPRDENWVPIPVNRVKEIQKMNRDGVIPPDLGEPVEITAPATKVLDYENVVGQDSLTRLDDRNRNRNNNSRNKKPNRPGSGQPNQGSNNSSKQARQQSGRPQQQSRPHTAPGEFDTPQRQPNPQQRAEGRQINQPRDLNAPAGESSNSRRRYRPNETATTRTEILMKQALNILLGISILFILTASSGCNDRGTVFDQNTEIANRNWGYTNLIKYNVKIDDAAVLYNLYFNMRVTGDYKYSNLFLLLHTTGPDFKPEIMRYELKLAEKTGEWLGSGSGNLYSYQIPFKTNFHFPVIGTYHFEIEQNMRDNPLHEVSDVGLRIAKVR